MSKEFICTSTEPVVSTKQGKLRGYKLGGTYHFYGVKYADAKRFRMPTEVEPWAGVKDALGYGYIAPLMGPESPAGDLTVPHRFWPKSEDCQYLNIWTQSIDPAAKKPVMLWIHGGGFAGGSSIEMVAYDGENLSEFGDVVVVSLNHRLNIIGYFDLSSFGDEYWNTANLGQADIVAALEWIRDNIAGFGGDPGNVTIFGQSGGGGKVNALLQTPAADGLFHKAIIESGLWREYGFPHAAPEEHRQLADAMIKELKLDGPAGLETISYDVLVAAYNAVAPALHAQGHETGFGPLPNDWYVGSALDVGFTEAALSRPVMAGTVFAEFAFAFNIKDKNDLSDEQRYAIVKEKYGEYTDRIIELFRAAYPDKNIVDVIALDTFFRCPAVDWLDARAAGGKAADTYSFVFAPDFGLDGGKPAWHCAEIPFAFHNVDKVAIANIPGADLLEKQTAGAWVNFARTGDPNNAALATWKPYTSGDETTMVFCEKSEGRSRFDKELLALVKKATPPMPAPGSEAKK